MYKITLDFPNLPKSGEGSEVDIAGIGRLQNGGTYVVSAADAEAFRIAHPGPVEAVPEQGAETSFETQRGPTLLQAFKDHPHIKVVKDTAAVPTQEGDK
jgi:hypothetical protein